jgi:hypothetical protein
MACSSSEIFHKLLIRLEILYDTPRMGDRLDTRPLSTQDSTIQKDEEGHYPGLEWDTNPMP